jgi:hypothetical protein
MGIPNFDSNDHYQVLGCNRDDDELTIKQAYRKLALKVCLSCTCVFDMYMAFVYSDLCALILLMSCFRHGSYF